jgi:hypothetical protein
MSVRMAREYSRAPMSNADVSRRSRIGPLVWWLGLGTTCLVTLAVSLVAYREGLAYFGIPQADKAVHISIGGALAFFLDGVLRRRTVDVGRLRIPVAALLILVPAAIEEFLQRYSPNRESSFADYAADLVGVALGVWLSRRVDR